MPRSNAHKIDRPHTKLSDDLEVMSSGDKLPAAEGLRYVAGALDSGRVRPGAVDSLNSFQALSTSTESVSTSILDGRR